MRRIGIFGGSFNPIHNGHIALARQLRELAGLDEVWLMVSPQNPWKRSSELLSDELRLELTREALRNEPHVVASDYEMHLPKPSYTWLTLQALERDFPDCRFTLLIGGDNWAAFHQWYRGEDILANYEVCVYPREGQEREVPAGVSNPRIVKAALLDVSSTEIRRRVRAGESIEGLVPPQLIERIETLYAASASLGG